MTPYPTLLYALVAMVMGLACGARADAVRTEAILFAKGHSAASSEGTIRGDQTIDYTLHGRTGQTIQVTLKTSNRANYFNVLPPGSNDSAIFIGSTSGNEWMGTLPVDGEYRVRVYLMRSAARRDETASYTLKVGVAGTPKASDLGEAPSSDAKVKGTPYHATGSLPCRIDNDKPARCEFGVIRGKPGSAELHITLPGGLKRVLTFMGQTVTASPDTTIKPAKLGDGWSIEVNHHERYIVPKAVISGG